MRSPYLNIYTVDTAYETQHLTSWYTFPSKANDTLSHRFGLQSTSPSGHQGTFLEVAHSVTLLYLLREQFLPGYTPVMLSRLRLRPKYALPNPLAFYTTFWSAAESTTGACDLPHPLRSMEFPQSGSCNTGEKKIALRLFAPKCKENIPGIAVQHLHLLKKFPICSTKSVGF